MGIFVMPVTQLFWDWYGKLSRATINCYTGTKFFSFRCPNEANKGDFMRYLDKNNILQHGDIEDIPDGCRVFTEPDDEDPNDIWCSHCREYQKYAIVRHKMVFHQLCCPECDHEVLVS